MACLRWKPVTATNSSRMRPFSARLPLLYRSMTAATSSSRVAMLTRLIAISPTPSGSGAFQMRQRINIREHFWRGNAHVEQEQSRALGSRAGGGCWADCPAVWARGAASTGPDLSSGPACSLGAEERLERKNGWHLAEAAGDC